MHIWGENKFALLISSVEEVLDLTAKVSHQKLGNLVVDKEDKLFQQAINYCCHLLYKH